jgi:ketosteroid isomerase-like protein
MGTDPTMIGFDFAAFRTAFEAKDVATWLSFYAEDADWGEFRHDAPPHARAGCAVTPRLAAS